jgi:hypothetical protein
MSATHNGHLTSAYGPFYRVSARPSKTTITSLMIFDL